MKCSPDVPVRLIEWFMRITLLVSITTTLLSCAKSNTLLEVLSLEKKSQPAREVEGIRSALMDSACRAWNLDEEGVAAIIALCDTMESGERYRVMCFVPCSVSGDIEWKGITYDYMINGVGAVWLRSDESEIYMGCLRPECREYFINEIGATIIAPPCHDD